MPSRGPVLFACALVAGLLGAPAAHAQAGAGVDVLEIALDNGILSLRSVSPGVGLTLRGDPATGEILLDRRAFNTTRIDITPSARSACRDTDGLDVRCARGSITLVSVSEGSPTGQIRLEVQPSLPVRVDASLGEGDDALVATPGRSDEIVGGNGQDTLTIAPPGAVGRADDAFRFNPDSTVGDGFLLPAPTASYRGFERITTGAGDDELRGGPDAVRFDALDGADTLHGSIRDDLLIGGGGGDRLQGDLGNDTLNAQDGDDVLAGDEGADVLNGGVGNDRLTGGPGADGLDGGAGSDIILARDGTRDRIACGDGADSLDLDLVDDFGAAQVCLATPPPAVAVFAARLDRSLRRQATARVSPSVIGPRGPQIAAGAVGEGDGVVLLPGLVRGTAGGRTALVRLRCPRSAGRACAGTVVVRIPGGRQLGGSRRHRIPAGATRSVRLTLTPSGARVGARPVLVRIAEQGALGPKTSAAVRVLAVGA